MPASSKSTGRLLASQDSVAADVAGPETGLVVALLHGGGETKSWRT